MLDEVYKEFEIYVKARHKKQGAYNILNELKYRVLPYFNSIDDFKFKANLLKWQSHILNLQFSNSYNKRLYYDFNCFLDYLVFNDNIKVNLLREIGSFPIKIEKRKIDFYTINEFNLFINHIDNFTYKVYYEVLFYTGLRPSEAMALTFNDIFKYYINVNKSLNRHGSREVDTTKNISSIRQVKIPKFLYNEIMKLNTHVGYYVFGGSKPISPTLLIE